MSAKRKEDKQRKTCACQKSKQYLKKKTILDATNVTVDALE